MSRHEFLIAGDAIDAAVEKKGEGYLAKVGDKSFEIVTLAPGLYAAVVDGSRKTIAAVLHNGTTYIDIDSVLIELKEPSADGFAGGAGEHGVEKDKIYAPMPGKIVKLMVAVGDSVEPKQPTVIVEAMKMENPVTAKAKGKVKAVHFKVGDQVDTDRPIIELELEA